MMMDLQLCLSVCLAIVARALCCLLGSEAKFSEYIVSRSSRIQQCFLFGANRRARGGSYKMTRYCIRYCVRALSYTLLYTPMPGP